jgi:hypothetical protein
MNPDKQIDHKMIMILNMNYIQDILVKSNFFSYLSFVAYMPLNILYQVYLTAGLAQQN